MHNSRFKADLSLLLVAILWGIAFGAQRATANIAGVWWFNGSRFLLAAITLSPFVIRRFSKWDVKTWLLVILTSMVLLGASALQQAGLRLTTAANAGFITSLYVVIVPVLGYVFFRRRTQLLTWIAALIAMLGAILLSTNAIAFHLAPGDGLELAGAVLWALHLILVDRIVKKVDVLVFATVQYFLAGSIQCLFGILFEPQFALSLGDAWWAIAYTGIISVAVGYTVQANAQRTAPPADAALILSTESVFAALTGYFILNENLSLVQLTGCVLIFLAVITAQLPGMINPIRGSRIPTQTFD